MKDSDEIMDYIHNSHKNSTNKERDLAQEVLNAVYTSLVCDSALYGMALDKLTNLETLEKDVMRLVYKQHALDDFIKHHIGKFAYYYCLKDPSEPEPEPRLRLVVNNK
jgi:hypothetical protein